MNYPRKQMSTTELIRECGFTREQLGYLYRIPGQRAARKMNPMSKNSKIMFDTDELDKLIKKQTELENREASRHFRIGQQRTVAI